MKKIFGRKKEIGLLLKSLSGLHKGKGSILLISGDTGVGKSTLIREALNNGDEHVYSANASEEGRSSYALPTHILRHYLRKNTSYEFDYGPLTKYLSTILPELGKPPDDIDADTLRESVVTAILNIGINNPSIIILDDIHWADSSTLDLIPVLGERIKNIPLLVLCVYRSDEITKEHKIRKLRDTLRRQKILNELIINPLNDEETSEMINEMLDIPISEKIIRSINQRTQGIPLFIEEIVTSINEKLFSRTSDDLNESGLELIIPQSLKDAVLERMKSLSVNEIEILEAAAIIGTEFEINFLLKINNDEKSLSELFEKKFLTESSNGKASFTHSLIREVIRNETGWIKRKQLHIKTAELLSAANSNPELIAEQWLSAGENNKAIKWMLTSAEASINSYAYEDAVDITNQALQLNGEKTDEENRINLLKIYAHSTQLLGRLEESISASDEIIEWAKKNSDYKLLGETHRSLAAIYALQNSHSDSINNRISSAENFELAGLLNESAQEYFVLARKKTSMLHIEHALLYSDKAVKLSEKTGSNHTRANVMGLYGNLLAMKGEVEKGRKLVEDALALAIENNEIDAASEIYRRLASTLEYQSDYVSARNAYINAYDFCINTGKEISAQICLSCMSYIFFQTGEWKKSLEICKDVLNSKFTPETSIPVGHGMIGIIQAFKGETKSAIKSLKEGLEYSTKYNTTAIELYIYWGLAVAHENDFNDKVVVENYKLFLNRWQSTQEMHDVVPPLMWAANYFSERGMQKEVAKNLEILGRISSETGNTEAMGALSFVTGESAMLNEKYSDAIKHFRQALMHHNSLSIPLEKLMIEFRLGMALLHKNETEEALKYLNSALRCAKNLGAKPLSAKIKKAAENSGAYIAESRNPESSERVSKAGLTSRQIKVLELVCEGLTNKEIAESLFLSSRTIDMHVSNILQRLNCKTRSEAINKSRELGIT